MAQTRYWIDVLHQYSVLLILGVIAGLSLANFDHHLYKQLVDYHPFGADATLFHRDLTFHFLINEVLMVFFFGIAAKEITDSILPGGSLNPIQRAINPIFSTVGGVVVPAGMYLLLVMFFYGGTEDFGVVANGWAIPTATDIALAWLLARVVFGTLHPAVNFLLLLAVADDAIGLLIIAVFYPNPEIPLQPVWLLLTVGGMGVAFAMRRMGVNQWWPYIAIAGVLSWAGLISASIEPALALVPIVPFIPSANVRHQDPIRAAVFPRGSHSTSDTSVPSHADEGPLEKFEDQLAFPVDVILFLFAFANTGVAFSDANEITVIILASLIVGKTAGITLFGVAGQMLGFPLPTGMGVKHLAMTALIAGLGLTVALFIAEKAFVRDSPFLDPAKMGAILSVGVAVLALVAGRLLRVNDLPAGETDESD